MKALIWLELFGYLGTVLVIISMLMTSVVRLRVINIIGGVISGIYALLIHAVPMALMNFCLIAINLFHLYRLLRTKRQFEIVESNGKDALVQYFLAHNGKDIAAYFPDFTPVENASQVAYVVCCNGAPAGILLGRSLPDGQVDVELDYTVPAYRDCSVGTYLYRNLDAYGVKQLIAAKKISASHKTYLHRMGFQEVEGKYIKTL